MFFGDICERLGVFFLFYLLLRNRDVFEVSRVKDFVVRGMRGVIFFRVVFVMGLVYI